MATTQFSYFSNAGLSISEGNPRYSPIVLDIPPAEGAIKSFKYSPKGKYLLVVLAQRYTILTKCVLVRSQRLFDEISKRISFNKPLGLLVFTQ